MRFKKKLLFENVENLCFQIASKDMFFWGRTILKAKLRFLKFAHFKIVHFEIRNAEKRIK